MKKDFIFAIVWSAFGYLFLFVFRSFSFLINNMLEGSHNSTIQLLNKVGVPLIGYILLGMLIGILALNLRYFSKLSIFITLSFAFYLVLKYPLMMTSNIFRFIYPRWMLLNLYETTTWFGGMIIASIIINIFNEKFLVLKMK